MKKNVLVYGLTMGVILSTFMVWGIHSCYKSGNFGGNETLGYTAIIAVFSFIFVGIRNYRNKFSDGFISFWDAFKLGMGIAFVASTIYVVTWLIYYNYFIPDFMDKYTAYVLNNAKENGLSQAQIDKQVAEMQGFKDMYKNPLFAFLITYIEVLPIGIIITLMSSLILKRKRPVMA